MRRLLTILAPLCLAVVLFVASANQARAQYVTPVVSYYYTPTPVVSYYTPTYYAPTVSYYAPPTVTYYAAPAVSYYAAPTVTYYAPAYAPATSAVTTTQYGLFGRPKSTTTYFYQPVYIRP
jgi:hypothetical protein